MRHIAISIQDSNNKYLSAPILIQTIQYEGTRYRVFQGLHNARPPYSVKNMETMESVSVERISEGFVD